MKRLFSTLTGGGGRCFARRRLHSVGDTNDDDDCGPIRPTAESAIDAQLAFARGTATSEALLEQSRRKVAQDGHLARAFVRREDDDDAL